MYDVPVLIRKIDEEIELEEKFRVEQDKQQHYDKHIAKDWDDFWNSLQTDKTTGFFNPKYPPTITMDAYEKKADDIIARDAGTSTDLISPLIGWKIKTKSDEGTRYKGDRYVKIKKTSSIINRNNFNRYDLPRLADVVIYVIQDGKPIVISMYPQTFKKAYDRMIKLYIDELPENKSDPNGTVTLFGKTINLKDINKNSEDSKDKKEEANKVYFVKSITCVDHYNNDDPQHLQNH